MYRIIEYTVVCLILLATGWVILLPQKERVKGKNNTVVYAFNDPAIKAFVKKSKSLEGSEDQPQGRAYYERLRHQNPFTKKLPNNVRNRELTFLNTLTTAHTQRGFTRGAARADDPWTLAGPYNIGGRTRAIALDVTDVTEKTIMAGGVTGGMWRSQDGGKLWTKTTLQNQMHSVSCVTQDPRAGHQNVWYYGTGETNFVDDIENGLLKGNGIFKSTDGGKSWNVLPSTQTVKPHVYDSPFDYTFNMVIDPQNLVEEEVYVAASGGIYRSLDGGGTWQRVLGTGNISGRYTDIAIAASGMLYASISNVNGAVNADAGIFRSADGITWENLTPTWWPSVFNKVALGLDPGNENKLYVLADAGTSSQKNHIVAVRNNNTWTNVSQNLPDYDYDTGDYDSQASFCMYIKVKPGDGQTVFLGGINLYRSTDGFSTITNTTWMGGYDAEKTDLSKYPNHHPDQHALVFFKDVNKMLSAHDGGISITTNNAATRVQWESLNTGYFTTQFYTVAMNNFKSDDVVIGGMQDNGSYGTNTLASKDKWRPLLAGDGSFGAISNNGKRYYVSSQYGRIFRLDFKDDGTYEAFTRVDPTGDYNYLFVNPFVLDPTNSNIMYLAGGFSVFRNDNLTSIPVNSNDPTTVGWTNMIGTETEAIISAISISSSPANILYYGTTNGQIYRVDNANSEIPVRTEITGTFFPKYLGTPTGYISSIGIDPFDANNVLVTFSNYETKSIFFTENGGTSWIQVGGNLEENQNGSGNGPAVYWTAMLHLESGVKYFVGTSIGLFTTDQLQGNNTQWENSGVVGAVPVYMIQARQLDGRVLAATHGNGIYKAEFSDVLPPLIQPITVTLGQNYPNPFSHATGTKIPFSVDEAQNVSLKVYDSQGKEIEILVDSTVQAGEFTIDFQERMKDIGPGVYYYRLQAGKFTKTLRMVVK